MRKDPKRYERPNVLPSVTYKRKFACHGGSLRSFYLTITRTSEGQGIMEFFLVVGKPGECGRCIFQAFARVVSIAFQYGTPLLALTNQMIGAQCSAQEVGGFTSCVDWVAQVLRAEDKGEEFKEDR